MRFSRLSLAFVRTSALLAIAVSSATLQGASVTYTDTDLGSGNPVTVGGVTLTTTTAGGSIGFIPGSGGFSGLHLGGNNSSGGYTLTFSQPITSLEIEFDALSDVGTLPVETIFNFATNLGSVSISYLNQFGTTFDGTTITSTENNGQGTISYTGGPFTSFSFTHNQGVQAGFVIERVTIDTDAVPEPGTVTLLGAGLVGILVARKRGRRA